MIDKTGKWHDIKENHQKITFDAALHNIKWSNPPDIVKITDKEEITGYAFAISTDDIKGDSGVGSGIAIIK